MSITLGTALDYVRQKVQTDSVGLTDAKGITFWNEALLNYRSYLIKRGVDAAQLQESYVATVTAPTAGNGSTFSYPSDMYMLKTIEVNMTDTNVNNYLTATQLDVANTPSNVSFSWLRENQSATQPLFDDRGDTYEIIPSFAHASNFTNAIRVIYYLQPTLYTSTSDNLVYPDSLNWYILAEKTAALYYESLNKFDEAEYWNNKYATDRETQTTTLAQGSKQPIQPTPLQISGWNF